VPAADVPLLRRPSNDTARPPGGRPLVVRVRETSRHANVLRTAHAKPLRGAARQVEPGALCVGDAPGSGIVDADGERTAIVRIGHGQRGAERPGARGGGVAVRVEAFAAGRAFAGRIVARQHFLSGAIAGRFDVFMNRAPARGVGRAEGEKADE